MPRPAAPRSVFGARLALMILLVLSEHLRDHIQNQHVDDDADSDERRQQRQGLPKGLFDRRDQHLAAEITSVAGQRPGRRQAQIPDGLRC